MVDGMIIIGTGKTYPDLFVGLIVLGAVFFMISLSFVALSIEEGASGIFSLSLAVLGIIASICIALYGATRPPIRTIKAIMGPGTDMNEVVRRYEVQTIDGQIWELVEKDEAALPDGDPGQ